VCNWEQPGSAWRDSVGVYHRGTEWLRMLPSDDVDGLDVQATEQRRAEGRDLTAVSIHRPASDDRRCRHRLRAAEQFLAIALINSPDETALHSSHGSRAARDWMSGASPSPQYRQRRFKPTRADGSPAAGQTDNLGPVPGEGFLYA
jgi:hypothetical protein